MESNFCTLGLRVAGCQKRWEPLLNGVTVYIVEGHEPSVACSKCVWRQEGVDDKKTEDEESCAEAHEDS